MKNTLIKKAKKLGIDFDVEEGLYVVEFPNFREGKTLFQLYGTWVEDNTLKTGAICGIIK